MAALAQEGAVLRARIIPLLLALGLRRSQHVRVMRGTTATLHQAHADCAVDPVLAVDEFDVHASHTVASTPFSSSLLYLPAEHAVHVPDVASP